MQRHAYESTTWSPRQTDLRCPSHSNSFRNPIPWLLHPNVSLHVSISPSWIKKAQSSWPISCSPALSRHQFDSPTSSLVEKCEGYGSPLPSPPLCSARSLQQCDRLFWPLTVGLARSTLPVNHSCRLASPPNNLALAALAICSSPCPIASQIPHDHWFGQSHTCHPPCPSRGCTECEFIGWRQLCNLNLYILMFYWCTCLVTVPNVNIRILYRQPQHNIYRDLPVKAV